MWLNQVRGGLVRREAEVGVADLDEVTARPQTRQRQRRIRSGRDHDVHRGREVVEEEGKILDDVAALDHVEVVKDEHEVARPGRQLMEECPQRLLDLWWRAFERRERPIAQLRRRSPYRGHDVSPERDPIAVRCIERDPGGGQSRTAAGQPVGDEGGLPESGWRRDERQLRSRGARKVVL